MKNSILLLFLGLVISSCSPFKKYAGTQDKWEKEVSNLLEKDKTETYSDDAILFIGSSSIRLWDDIAKDMAPYEPIRRGYGGAKFSDLIHFTERIVYPHNFQALCIFVANDITGGNDDRTPKEVLTLQKQVIKTVRKKYPAVPIFQIAITPVNSRWSVWNETQQANALMKANAEKTPNLYFIETADGYLGEDGKPISALFRDDQLHMKPDGYHIWARIIKAELDKVLK